MTEIALAATSKALVESLCCDDDVRATLRTQLLRLLAKGQPVSRARLAAALGSSPAMVDATLREIPNIEFDNRGDIIASGLSLLPTPHQFQINTYISSPAPRHARHGAPRIRRPPSCPWRTPMRWPASSHGHAIGPRYPESRDDCPVWPGSHVELVGRRGNIGVGIGEGAYVAGPW